MQPLALRHGGRNESALGMNEVTLVPTETACGQQRFPRELSKYNHIFKITSPKAVVLSVSRFAPPSDLTEFHFPSLPQRKFSYGFILK
jgi:hypothetical protein